MVPVDKVASLTTSSVFQVKTKNVVKAASSVQAPDAGDLKTVQAESQPGSIPEIEPEEEKEKVEKNEAANGYKQLSDLVRTAGLDMRNVRLEFEQDQNSGRMIVRVVDRETDETVREIPPEELLHAQQVIQNLVDGNQELRGTLVEIVT